MPFFSIIVPVYNTEQWLRECVQSVLSQKFTDYELILIDDGSTDESGTICDELAEHDARIRVIHQENSGAAAARNAGIQAAAGQYILFMDSDDRYANDQVLQRLSPYTEDVVCFNYARLAAHAQAPGACLLHLSATLSGPMDADFYALVRDNIYTSSAWSKRIARQVLVENELYFEPECRLEDIEWNLRLACHATSITFEPHAVYLYRLRAGSVTQSMSQAHVDDLFAVIERLERDCPSTREPLFQHAYRGYVAFQYCTLLINIRLAGPSCLTQNLRHCKRLQHLLKEGDYRVVRLIRFVSNLVGIRCCSFLLYHYFLATQPGKA